MSVALPAPGGSVGLSKFAVYTAGAAGGIALYSQVISAYVPDTWENWSVGPISGMTVLFAASALVGAAMAAKVMDLAK